LPIDRPIAFTSRHCSCVGYSGSYTSKAELRRNILLVYGGKSILSDVYVVFTDIYINFIIHFLESVFDFSGQSIFSTSKFDCIHCQGERLHPLPRKRCVKPPAGPPRRAPLRRASVIGGRTGAIAIRQRGCEAKAAAAPHALVYRKPRSRTLRRCSEPRSINARRM
jgi:hypothetical protein